MNPGKLITNWYREHGRTLPWREDRDPYKIWISEIILQQTQVIQGADYFIRFIEKFPTLKSLGEATLDQVLKSWEGLGYYSRARNLHFTAIDLVTNHKSTFPNSHTQLQKLKGIGPYTSRAISALAFDEAVGVVDGNVFRVYSRYHADSSPIDLPATRTKVQHIVDQWVKGLSPSDFNQGMMDLGATICKPSNPLCSECPLMASCKAYSNESWMLYPVKVKKMKKKTRYFVFNLHKNDLDQFYIQQRPKKGIWGGLWEIPNHEIELSQWEAVNTLNSPGYLGKLKHIFTHFTMEIKVISTDSETKGKGEWVKSSEFPNFAFAKGVQKIFDLYIPLD